MPTSQGRALPERIRERSREACHIQRDRLFPRDTQQREIGRAAFLRAVKALPGVLEVCLEAWFRAGRVSCVQARGYDISNRGK